MSKIKQLTDLCQWELKSGSHEWPGPGGGTCINEAAIVASGFEYKSVGEHADCPPCFSPVISAYLISINDSMPDEIRQKLMRFVTRLSGSSDTPAVEQQRLEYIILETVKRIVSLSMDAVNLTAMAAMCRSVVTLDDARKAAEAVYATSSTYVAVYAVYATSATNAAAKVGYAADAAAEAAVNDAAVYAHAIEIVDGALAIGNQATDSDAALVLARMNSARKIKAYAGT